MDLKRKRNPICEYCGQYNCDPYLRKSKCSDLRLCNACHKFEKRSGKLIPIDCRRSTYHYINGSMDPYTQKDVDILKKMRDNDDSWAEIAKKLKRNIGSVKQKYFKSKDITECKQLNEKSDSLGTEDDAKVKTENKNKIKKIIKITI
jgi:hypothetical protein